MYFIDFFFLLLSFFFLAVFYNPVQETNRDLSVAVLKEFVKLRQAEEIEKQAKRMGKRKFDDIETMNEDDNQTSSTSNTTSATNAASSATTTTTSVAPTTAALVASAQLKPLRVLEALSATGINC